MGIIKMVLEAFGIFAVTVFTVVMVEIKLKGPDFATGALPFFRVSAPLFVVIGVLFLAFGIFLWSPAPFWLLRR
jgi:hypothetical protein